MPRPTRLRFHMPAKLVARPIRPLPNFVRQKLHGETQPKLYNAKRLIPTSRGLPAEMFHERKMMPKELWRDHVSADVAEFIDDMEAQGTKMSPREQKQLLRSPAEYFSVQHHVPKTLRQQVYFPPHFIAMRRNDYLGPNYAQFNVPLNFSKLELKSYLKEVYDVDVVHVRSYVTRTHIARRKQKGKYTRPARFRSRSQKRMTVQLLKPFTWPVKPSKVDRTLFDHKSFYEVQRASSSDQKDRMFHENEPYNYVDRQHRKLIAEQAKLMHLGKAEWQPTWQLFDSTRKQFTGRPQIPKVNLDQKLLPPGDSP